MEYEEMKDDDNVEMTNIILREGWRWCIEGDFLVTMIMIDYVLTILTHLLSKLKSGVLLHLKIEKWIVNVYPVIIVNTYAFMVSFVRNL